MKRPLPALAVALALGLASPPAAHSFCGFYVSTGEGRLTNHASKVVLARDADRTVITMLSDYQGEPKDFAVVVPVPTVIEKDQVHIGDPALVQRIEDWSKPRLVEYFDPPPCARAELAEKSLSRMSLMAGGRPNAMSYNQGVMDQVRIEAQYTVGEYDILVLSATQSGALMSWLRQNGYRVPPGAGPVVASYLKQGMKFFVAKVNLKEQQKLGFHSLRPIQVAYESPKFMLPVRLGMANADGAQELLVFTLTRQGRVECSNYRTVKMPTDVDVPEYVKDKFGDAYTAAFDRQVQREGMGVVFTEYSWDMGWCDPCAGQPLTPVEQRALGAFWIDSPDAANGSRTPQGQSFCTRLHVRYDAAHFPEDLVFQQTPDRTNWQARYVLHHPYHGDLDCSAGAAYRASVRERRQREATNLAELTGWSRDDIRRQMAVGDDWSAPEENLKWYQRLWSEKTGAVR